MRVPVGPWGEYERLLHRKHRSKDTISLYRTVLHDLWRFLGEDCGLLWWQVTPELADQWLRRPGKPGRHGAGLPLGPATRSTYGGVAWRSYRLFAARGWLDANPLEDWEPPRPPGPRPRALPVPALGELLVVVDPRVRMMVQLGYHQALRVGEIVRLRVGDLALGTNPPMLFVRGKGGNDCWMELSPELVGPLRSWMAVLAGWHGAAQWSLPAALPLIPNYTHPGEPLAPKYAAHLLATVMRPVVGDSGHALRHTALQQLRRITRDPWLVKEAARHSSLAMLERYIGPEPGWLAAALAQLPPIQETRRG